MKIRKNSVSGVALIIVLGFLVIISALAVAFFSSVNTELKASRNFAAGITTRQLADSSIQIVMGQIANATTRGIDAGGVGHEAWASQPGMLRVYGMNTGGSYQESNRADAFFKLYSSDKMVLTASDLDSFNPGADFLPAWDQSPAYWTDLNAPVMVRDASGQPSPRFPVIDPRAYAIPIDLSKPDWTDNVEGFYYDQSAANGIVPPGGNANLQRLPMPVRWIYVLQDGTLTTPDSQGAGVTASFSQAPAEKRPSVANPIVGRVAFWTDDETCKLNLNTAAGYSDNLTQLNSAYQNSPSSYPGSYWDTPRFYTQFDYGIPGINNGQQTGVPDPNKASGGLALCQLLQNEFQRYPGHPATTSLAPVLNKLLTSEQIYGVTPRYSNRNLQNNVASTQGGTQRVIVDPINIPGDLDNKQLQPKQDRLYATPDEFLFGAHVRGTASTNPAYSRVNYLNNTYAGLTGEPTGPLTPEVIDRWRFFLSTQGRAPELNLSGQPRVTCWPVRSETASETTGMNVFDNLILFCSTVGSAGSTGARPDTKTDLTSAGVYRYIFTRREVNSNTDLVQQTRPDVIGNLPKRMEFRPTYVPDWKLNRNSQLLSSYLWSFMTKPVPGNGKRFVGDKYKPENTGDAQGVLTEIFDYIRLANSQDTTTSLAPPGKAIKFAPTGNVGPSKPAFATGWSGKGFGRVSTLCEASLVFYYAGPQMDNMDPNLATNTFALIPKGSAPNQSWSRWDPVNPLRRYVLLGKDINDIANYGRIQGGYMRAFILFSTFDPMQGYAPKADPGQNDPKLTIEGNFQAGFSAEVDPVNAPNAYKSLGFPVGTVSTTIYRAPASTWGGRNYGGYEGFAHTIHGNGDTSRPNKVQWAPGVPTTNLFGTGTALHPELPDQTNPNPLTTDYGLTWVPFPASSNPNGQYIARAFTTTAAGSQEYYPFQSVTPLLVPNYTKVFNFHGGTITVKLYYGGSSGNTVSPALQTFTLKFPDAMGWPVPQGAPQFKLNAVQPPNAAQLPPSADPATWLAIKGNDPNIGLPLPATVGNPNPGGQGMRQWYWTGNGCFFANMGLGLAGRVTTQQAYRGGIGFETSLQASWSFATRQAWVDVANGDSWDPHTNSTNGAVDPGWWGDRWRNIVQPGDTIRSLIYWDGANAEGGKLSGAGATKGGDLRIAALSDTVPDEQFQPHPDYFRPYSRACSLRAGDGTLYFPSGTVTGNSAAPGNFPTLVGATSKTVGASAVVYAGGASDSTKEATFGNHIYLGQTGLRMQPTRAFANLPWGGGGAANPPTGGVNGVRRPDDGGQHAGDFDTGVGDFPDGPFCNKQDEGNVIYQYFDTGSQRWVFPVPYFTSTWTYQPPGNTFTSPSRQMPSPGMFGSLPSKPQNGGLGGSGWTTLSFSPNPAGENHPGNIVEPKDHYLLDLFQMPVVEPYPISEPFSTAGKVNLNYRIVPFDYIRRSTALRGALYPLRVTAVNSQYQQGGPNFLVYKTGTAATPGYPSGTPITQNFRLRVDRNETIKSLDGFFDLGLTDANQGFFKSATEICEHYLYATGSTVMTYPGSPSAEATMMDKWWTINGDLTGDNEREKPYVDLYPRITTKSNTYTVHMKVQTLRQTPGHPTEWKEGIDSVLGEYRGSATIERYIDPADPRFSPGNSPHFNPDEKSLEPLYRFRTVYTKKFTP